MKTFRIFGDCQIKSVNLKRKLFWKLLVPFFRRTYALSVGFNMKPRRKIVFQCEGRNQLKILTIYNFSNYVAMEYIEIKWLCRHKKKVRSSQASFPINFCTELGKTQVFSVIIVNACLEPFSDIYDNGKYSCSMNQKCGKFEFALNCGYWDVQLQDSPIFKKQVQKTAFQKHNLNKFSAAKIFVGKISIVPS